VVVVETGAGEGIGITDAEYRSAGATVASSVEEVFGSAD
jgi:alanine dehydrogenase